MIIYVRKPSTGRKLLEKFLAVGGEEFFSPKGLEWYGNLDYAVAEGADGVGLENKHHFAVLDVEVLYIGHINVLPPLIVLVALVVTRQDATKLAGVSYDVGQADGLVEHGIIGQESGAECVVSTTIVAISILNEEHEISHLVAELEIGGLVPAAHGLVVAVEVLDSRGSVLLDNIVLDHSVVAQNVAYPILDAAGERFYVFGGLGETLGVVASIENLLDQEIVEGFRFLAVDGCGPVGIDGFGELKT